MITPLGFENFRFGTMLKPIKKAKNALNRFCFFGFFVLFCFYPKPPQEEGCNTKPFYNVWLSESVCSANNFSLSQYLNYVVFSLLLGMIFSQFHWRLNSLSIFQRYCSGIFWQPYSWRRWFEHSRLVQGWSSNAFLNQKKTLFHGSHPKWNKRP